MSGTVLLVDDDPGVRDILSHFISRIGLGVIAAETAADALAKFQACPGQIHILLTDVSMPGMNGVDLARMLLAREPQLKIVLMSGLLEEPDLRGATAVLLPKPFSRDTLETTLLNLMNRAQAVCPAAPPQQVRPDPDRHPR